MKILVFIRLFNESTATFIYNELTELINLGHQVKVTCLQRLNPEKFPFPDVAIIPMSRIQKKISYGLSKYGIRMDFSNKPFRERFEAIVRQYQPDIIHCHFGLDALFVLDNFHREDIPVFISFHGYDASSLLFKRIYRKRLAEVFQRPEVFPVFVSHFMLENISRFGIGIPRNFILYYGTDISFFSRKQPPPPPDPFTFLQVSSFREKKGHEYTVRAFSRLLDVRPELSCRLVLAGDGPLLPAMKKLAGELGVAGSVEFPGLVTPVQAREWMEKAHAFLHHSVTASRDGDMEGIPNALMEAMAMELPVISTYHAGIPELVEDGMNGYLVEERDVETYAQRMESILDWDRLPQNREKIAELFERRKHAQMLTDYYKEALEVFSPSRSGK